MATDYRRPDRQLGEALRDLVVAKLTEKAAERDRATTKSRLQAEALDLLTARIGALDLWTRVPPAGRRPRLSRDELAAAAVRIADAEGIRALSMRRLATDLDVGTMTLYHYVRTKDELLTVVMDAVMGEVVIPDDEPLPVGWREALQVIAQRSLDSLRRHPWILDIADDPPIGPNSVRHFDQSLQAMAALDVPLAQKLDVVSLVDEYVFGYCLMERNNVHTHHDDDDAAEDMVAYVSVLLETGAYPQLAALAQSVGLRQAWEEIATSLRDERRFQRNLERILNGVAADLAVVAT